MPDKRKLSTVSILRLQHEIAVLSDRSFSQLLDIVHAEMLRRKSYLFCGTKREGL